MQISRNWESSTELSGDAALAWVPREDCVGGDRARPSQKLLPQASCPCKMESDTLRFSRDPLFLPSHFNHSF